MGVRLGEYTEIKYGGPKRTLSEREHQGPSGPRKATQPIEPKSMQKYEQALARRRLNAEYDLEAGTLEPISKLDRFEETHEPFVLGEKNGRLAAARGHEALAKAKLMANIQRDIHKIRGSQSPEEEKMKLKMIEWYHDAKSFLKAAYFRPEIKMDFWRRVFEDFAKLGHDSLEAAEELKVGLETELAIEQAYSEAGFDVWESRPEEDLLGIDFFARIKNRPAKGGNYLGGYEVHQVKAKSVASQEVSRFMLGLAERLEQVYSPDNNKEKNNTIAGWYKYFHIIGESLPGIYHEIPVARKTFNNDGTMTPLFKRAFMDIIQGKEPSNF